MAIFRLHRQRIALEGEAAQLVEDLAAERGLTVPEVVRQALLRERWFQDRMTAGDTLMVEGTDKSTRTIQFVEGAQGALAQR
jgi:hypothetical protein